MRVFVLVIAVVGCWRSSDPAPARPVPPPAAPTGGAGYAGAGYGGAGYAQLGMTGVGAPIDGPIRGTIQTGTAPHGTIGTRTPTAPTVSAGQPSSHGDLDKALIRRAIKTNIQAISACYEKELGDKPSLAGTLLVQFLIERDGTVTHASGSGVDPVVSSCVVDVIKAIKFPSPKGGGGVQVN